MSTTKKTRRNTVKDTYDNTIVLLKNYLREDDSEGYEPYVWTLSYKELRAGLTKGDFFGTGSALVNIVAHSGKNKNYATDIAGVHANTFAFGTKKGQPKFNIGCHSFDLNSFNRILRAAGIKTSRKALAATAGA